MTPSEEEFVGIVFKYGVAVAAMTLLTFVAITSNITWAGLVAGLVTVAISWRGFLIAWKKRNQILQQRRNAITATHD